MDILKKYETGSRKTSLEATSSQREMTRTGTKVITAAAENLGGPARFQKLYSAKSDS